LLDDAKKWGLVTNVDVELGVRMRRRRLISIAVLQWEGGNSKG
jgi:hypothetical protein